MILVVVLIMLEDVILHDGSIEGDGDIVAAVARIEGMGKLVGREGGCGVVGKRHAVIPSTPSGHLAR